MKYACLIYGDGNLIDPLPAHELQALVADTLAYDEELRRAGHFVMGDPLGDTSSATTIQMRDGTLSVTDGPYMETKEQLGGFIVIEARDLSEAIRIMGRHPIARYDTIEIRPVGQLPAP